MSRDRHLRDERNQDSIPRVKKDHLREHRVYWPGSTRREAQRPDEKGALAVLVTWDRKRVALYSDQGDLLRIKELDR